ncbi:MAG: glycosyltransferase family 39 protein [Gallionella sp.]|nr:glycosyltransferase family 39 protein [Gallionella sp.]
MNLISNKQWWYLIIAVAVIWFSNLEYRILIKPDEGRYAEIPREMVASGDWTTPRLNDIKYFEKPPLQYWATAVAYEVFGEHQWTSRLWAGLTGFFGIFLVWFAGLRLFGREAAAYAAMLLGSSLLYVLIGHVNTLDMGVTFFISLGIFAFLIAQNEGETKSQRNWMLWAWAGMALAVLSKGLMGLILPGTAIFIYCIVQRDFSVLKRMHWLSGLAVFFLISAPWFYFVMKANPEFFDKFFIYEHFTRFTTKQHGRYQPWYYFVPILLSGMLPWTLLMLDTLWRTWRTNVLPAKVFNAARFLLIWSVFIYLFFTASGSKLPSYLLPIFPALALLMGKRIAEMSSQTLLKQIAPVILFVFALLVLALNVGKLADTPLQKELYPQYTSWLVVASLTLLAGLLISMWLLRREKKMIAVATLAISSLLFGQIGLSGYNVLASERSAKHIAAAIAPQLKTGVPFYSVLDYEQTLPFYLKRTFTLVQYQDEMGFGLGQEPQRWIPSVEEFAPVWADQTEAYAIIRVHDYPRLQQLGLSMQIIFQDSQNIVVKKL